MTVTTLRNVRSPDADIIALHIADHGITQCRPINYNPAYKLHRVRGGFMPRDLDPCKLVLELPSEHDR